MSTFWHLQNFSQNNKQIKFWKLTQSSIIAGVCVSCWPEILVYKIFVTEIAECCNVWYHSNCTSQFICCMASKICIFKEFFCSFTIWRIFETFFCNVTNMWRDRKDVTEKFKSKQKTYQLELFSFIQAMKIYKWFRKNLCCWHISNQKQCIFLLRITIWILI